MNQATKRTLENQIVILGTLGVLLEVARVNGPAPGVPLQANRVANAIEATLTITEPPPFERDF